MRYHWLVIVVELKLFWYFFIFLVDQMLVLILVLEQPAVVCQLGMHRRWRRSVASWRLYFSGRRLTMTRRSWLYCTVCCLPATTDCRRFCRFVSRAPSVSCATRLKLSICLFIYFFYPGISSEPLNLSQQKFARWRQLVRNRIWRVWIFEGG